MTFSRGREREGSRVREDVHARDHAHRHAPPVCVPRTSHRRHDGRDHQQDPGAAQGRPEDRLHVEMREGLRGLHNEPVRDHLLRRRRQGGQGHASGPDQRPVPGLGHVVERGLGRAQVQVAVRGHRHEPVLEEDPGLRRM